MLSDWPADFLFLSIGSESISLQSFIYFSGCISSSSDDYSTVNHLVQLPECPPCPQGNPPWKVKPKTAVLKRDWFRHTGAKQDPSNKSTSSCQTRIKVCEKQLAEQHKCSSCCRCYVCYCLVCKEQEPVTDIISASLNNVDNDKAVLQASCKTHLENKLVFSSSSRTRHSKPFKTF